MDHISIAQNIKIISEGLQLINQAADIHAKELNIHSQKQQQQQRQDGEIDNIPIDTTSTSTSASTTTKTNGTSENEVYEPYIKSLKEEIDRLTQDKMRMVESEELLRRENERLNKEVQTRKDFAATSIAEKEVAQRQLESLEHKLADIEQTHEKLLIDQEIEIDTLRQANEKMSKDLQEQHSEMERKRLEHEQAQQPQQVNEVMVVDTNEQLLHKQIEELKEENSRLSDESSALKERMKEQMDEYQRTQDEERMKQDQLLQNKMKEYQENNEQLMNNVTTKHEETNQLLQNKIQELDNETQKLKQQIQSNIDEIAKLESARDAQQQELKKVIDESVAMAMKNANQRVTELEAHLAQADHDLKSTQAQQTMDRKQLEEAQQQRQEYKDKVMFQDTMYRPIMEDLKRENENLKQQISDINERQQLQQDNNKDKDKDKDTDNEDTDNEDNNGKIAKKQVGQGQVQYEDDEEDWDAGRQLDLFIRVQEHVAKFGDKYTGYQNIYPIRNNRYKINKHEAIITEDNHGKLIARRNAKSVPVALESLYISKPTTWVVWMTGLCVLFMLALAGEQLKWYRDNRYFQ
ncbi:hypothetical protein SAMD00019534_004700 [Acytostelium subglobosum LB1]|uniref:hypothetical protein n=1 Tax=Acytostelium subglobosum LB1 TaxID=1410327 RepID=UPI0006452203|nr:hypothetical protein SAMD00019534_004700 [Acytostelium subglobosum LB1]GAM17295.1 hypothetical protein SAMD00019534_004700 [Acytostelium subglobosum LB1]|eukprot:XP_012759357.1 hypothetical protein SAMD00019534_004700 [Acytostelium subglobosum LB1]